MDKAEQYQQIISRAKEFRVLNSIPEFVRFKAEVIQPRIDAYREAALLGDTTTEEGRRSIASNVFLHQELKGMFDDLFRSWEVADQTARKRLGKNVLEGK